MYTFIIDDEAYGIPIKVYGILVTCPVGNNYNGYFFIMLIRIYFPWEEKGILYFSLDKHKM